MKVLSDDDFEELVGKAGAWDKHVAARLAGGVVTQDVRIICVSGDAEIKIVGAEVVTPFGRVPVKFTDKAFRMFAGDSIIVSNAVHLTIS